VPVTAVRASVVAGASSSIVLANLYVSAHSALLDWVRARGLAIFLTVIFGAVTVGSAVWGRVAGMEGLPVAHFIAAAGAILFIPLTWRWKLIPAAGFDPSISERGRRLHSASPRGHRASPERQGLRPGHRPFE
jgi:hypothetical protein